jgi:glutamine synthetase
MSSPTSLRSQAVLSAVDTAEAAAYSSTEDATGRVDPVSASFGMLALTWRQLADKVDDESAAALRDLVLKSTPLPRRVGDRLAEVVQSWAVELGVTHYTHWFHPLTGLIAEKHDAFLGFEYSVDQDPKPIESFSGSGLLQGEPDASSFPHGGLRATHEARGYTMWDPTSPMFVRCEGGTRTLCIPTSYISWKGEALDYKTPLLRARETVSRASVRMLRLLGDDKVQRVMPTLGPEQEYFVVDRAFLASRPDLLLAGRTLLGRLPQRNQQLEDHYFGAIPARVQAFISEADNELYLLGVPVKTRHNEVAPAQFESAPVFEELNIAVDHNVLTMDVLKRVAERHGLVCLLHEKPFAGINGSGKHNNWALATDSGENLMDPGDDPVNDLRFLVFFAAVLHTLNQHGAVLRATVASVGNDHRLGANEAPPPIISAFLGDALTGVMEAVITGGESGNLAKTQAEVVHGIHVRKDTGDRNRTSPFAFTGNKFEFRAVGSSDNPAWAQTVLNTAMADSLHVLADRMEALGGGEDAVRTVVRQVLQTSRRVCFDGNGYGSEWVEEAERRGLPILRNTPAALAVLLDHDQTAFLTERGVLSRQEVHARADIALERYIKWLQIEAGTMLEMVSTQVVPAVEADLIQAAKASKTLKDLGVDHKHAGRRARTLGQFLEDMQQQAHLLGSLAEELVDAAGVEGASAWADRVIPVMNALRTTVDAAEAEVSDSHWPLPKYREMLFLGVS